MKLKLCFTILPFLGKIGLDHPANMESFPGMNVLLWNMGIPKRLAFMDHHAFYFNKMNRVVLFGNDIYLAPFLHIVPSLDNKTLLDQTRTGNTLAQVPFLSIMHFVLEK